MRYAIDDCPQFITNLVGWLLLSSLILVTSTFLFGFAGRNDYRNSGSRGHASGLPRPYAGHGRGRSDASRWDSITKNSPGAEAFPGGWGAGGSGSGGGATTLQAGNGGWSGSSGGGRGW